MTCPGSVALCEGLPDTGSVHADEGTLAHAWAAYLLDTAVNTTRATQPRPAQPLTDDMRLHVDAYTTTVEDIALATSGALLIEQRLPLGHITGEAGAHGTADAVILADRELIVIDLKYGRGVEVDARDNPQLALYALAAMDYYDMLGPWDRVRMVIHQPRLKAVSEWTQTAAEMEAFRAEVKETSAEARMAALETDRGSAWDAQWLKPTDKGCRWCKAKATCPALRAEVLTSVFGTNPATLEDFADLRTPAQLGGSEPEVIAASLTKVEMVEAWCKAVRAEAERRLLAGDALPGWKLVQGRRGPRQWTDPEAAEQMLRKTFRLPVEKAYELKLISPTAAERLATAGDIGARQWPKLQDLIHQPEGKPSVAPESDKRPALTPTVSATDFAVVSPV